MKITIEVTPELKCAAKFAKRSVREFSFECIQNGVETYERDYILDPHTGEVIGDRLEMEAARDSCAVRR